jgi:two-component system, OmpR family, response regulator TctD
MAVEWRAMSFAKPDLLDTLNWGVQVQSMAKILLVEDNPQLATSLIDGLRSQGNSVEHIVDGTEALYRLEFYHFDLAILDWNLPGLSGLEICKQYRKKGGNTPILMLTGKDQVSEKEYAFDSGADDYLTKPFAFRELSARIRALLRRPPSVLSNILQVGPLTMDIEKKTIFVDGQLVSLKPSEFILLELFMKAPGRVFSPDEILEKLYPSESEATADAVRQRVNRVRKALGEYASMIINLKAIGYKLEER